MLHLRYFKNDFKSQRSFRYFEYCPALSNIHLYSREKKLTFIDTN